MVKSAVRVFKILETIGMNGNGLTHSEIKKSLLIPTSSLSSLLASLVDLDYLLHVQESKRYTLGPQILILAGNYLKGLDIIELGRPIVRKLSSLTTESAALVLPKECEVVIVYRKDSPHPVKRVMHIGETLPMYSSASGKIFLSYLSDDELDRYLSTVELKQKTPSTIVNPDVLRREIKLIPDQGIAYNRGENSKGVFAISTPVIDFEGTAVAALVVSFPNIRFSHDKKAFIEKCLRQESSTLSHQLGYVTGTNKEKRK